MSDRPDDAVFATLARRASDRFATTSLLARNFARGKLISDPVYEEALRILRSGVTLLDIGCGQGLMLALLIDAGAPRFERLIGIETRARMVRLARSALGGAAEIREADARTIELERCSAVLLFDVLQMMAPGEQESMLATLRSALEPNGIILIREADASAGWRYQTVRVGNRLKSLLLGAWSVRRHYRTREEWLSCFQRLGLTAEVCPMPSRNPLGNVLFRVGLK